MQAYDSVDDILRYAIQQEDEAAALYQKLAAETTKPGMRQLYEGFALEEYGHKVKLENILAQRLLQPASTQTVDMRIIDYLVEPESDADAGYQSALIAAMKREKAAFRLYSDLAAQCTNADVKATLLSLAQEEAKHKLRFEIEYDDAVQPAN